MKDQATTPARRERLWSLDFVFALGMVQFIFAGFTAQYTVIPEYVVHRGGEEWQLGIVIGSFSIATMLVRPHMGKVGWQGRSQKRREF